MPGAGGAQGIIGAGINSNTGTGSDVVVADFDVNGFPDLFVTNGLNLEPDRIGGPDQLFLNKGSPNHWVKIHLVGKVSDPSGIVSNRDAIGAKVRAIAGGVTQTLEQSGGYHRWSQSLSNPVHIGLGTNTQARIEVVWPSGRVDTFLNVQANDVDGSAFYRVTEGNASNPTTIAPVTLGPVPPFPAPQSGSGDECGVPAYVSSLDAALFLYRNCSSGVWSLRVTAGGITTNVRYQGKLDANQPFTIVAPFNLESGDTPSPTATYPFSATPPFAFTLNTSFGKYRRIRFRS